MKRGIKDIMNDELPVNCSRIKLIKYSKATKLN